MLTDKMLTAYLVPNKELIVLKEVDGDILILHKSEMEIYESSKTANLILKEVVKKKKIGEIIEIMQRGFKGVSKETIKKDVILFINSLLKKKTFFLKE